ncbi:MAG: hypothetical protein ACTSUB_06205 [Candidatus Thorarchaeota archaeon]
MEDTEETRRIWNIREHIDELEKIKDKIIALPDMDSAWVGDAKDFYFHVVSSWTLLKSCPRLEGEELNKRTQNVKFSLTSAKDKYNQVLSEVKVLADSKGDKLCEQLESVFKLIFDAISESLEPYLPVSEDIPPANVIRKDGPMRFFLDCCVCSTTGAALIADPEAKGTPTRIIYGGITTGGTLKMKPDREIFDLLERGSLKDVHAYLQENTYLEDGIDAYCPECDTIYCENHLTIESAYDAGFITCTYATCPKGHRRIIDG